MTAIGISPSAGAFATLPRVWRFIGSRIWQVEHAFERAKAEGRPADDVRIRMAFILAMFAAGFLALTYGAVRTAVFPDRTPVGRVAPLTPGSRADLVDRNGQLLALDLPYYNLYLDRSLIWDVEETETVLGPMLPPSARARMKKALTGERRMKIMGPLSPDQRRAIDNLGLPGVSFETEARRSYPLGDTAPHLIGFAGAGGVGLSGAELALDDRIHGQAGREPVTLALDLRVQAALEDELRKTAAMYSSAGAVGIVTNVRTGEVLAMASWPDAAPNQMDASPAAKTNRAANSVFEMGSIMKVFSVAIGLDSGTATLNTIFDATTPVVLPGQVIRDYHAKNTHMTLAEVFLNSSNIGTSRLALRFGGPTMAKYFKTFGLMDAAPIELKETAKPLAGGKWSSNTVASRSFGHAIAVSPLQVAAGMGAILNGGTYVPLTILKRDAPPTNGRRVVSEDTSRQMLDLMRLNAVEGTGKSAEAGAQGLRSGGKTGTAEKPMAGGIAREKLVSSYAAVFPTDGPVTADRYYVLMLFDEPKSLGGRPTGGIVAAPAVGRVINRIAPFVKVERRLTATAPMTPAGKAAPTLPEAAATEGTATEPSGVVEQ